MRQTTAAAALVNDDGVRAAFDKIAWASVGQQPDTAALQQTLHIQLTAQPLPEAAKADARVALEVLKDAAKGLSVLLVLDDVWVASHADPLNFVEPLSVQSAVIITTRIRSLINGAAEIQCETLSTEASLELLLRAGGQDKLLSAPPPAALEAVELCGKLPLALGIAGAIIEELADGWQDELLPLLKEELDETSVEERVVTASLRVVPKELRAGVEGLFAVFGAFAEDAIVPAAAVDLLVPLMVSDDATKRAAQQKRQVRRWLMQLLKANVMRGSIEKGVSVHDLVRDCMIQRAEASRDGGLPALQREAVPLMLIAFDSDGPAASYVSGSLQWHVRQARQPDLAIHADALMMRVLTHNDTEIRKQGALGVGMDALRAAADVCDDAGEHFTAAELMWAACAVRGTAAGAEAQRATASLQKLNEMGRESTASRALERNVLGTLFFVTEGGHTYGSTEHNAVMDRMAALGRRASVGGVDGKASCAVSKEAMDAEFQLAAVHWMAAMSLDGTTVYPGKITLEVLMQVDAHQNEAMKHTANAAALAPKAAFETALWGWYHLHAFYWCRRHVLPTFSFEDAFGAGGERLRRTIERSVMPAAAHA